VERRVRGPRGCRVDALLRAVDRGGGGKPDARFEGLGFKVGSNFVGVATGAKVGGVGLKLPGVLFGVATKPGKKVERPPVERLDEMPVEKMEGPLEKPVKQ
jgi:hypothetical protein